MARMKCTDLADLRAMLGDKDKVVVGNNTIVQTDGDALEVRLHGHRIVVFHANGNVTLNDCCWRTPTTNDRLSQFCPGSLRLWQEKGEWFWRTGSDDAPRPWPGSVTVTAEGQPLPTTNPTI